MPLHWETWIKSGIQRLSDVIKHNTVVPFSELKSKHNLKDTELFRYMQLKNWIIRYFDLGKNTGPEISNIFKTIKKRRLIGSMYNLLISSENSDTLLEKIYNKYTEDLGAEVKEKWKECLSLTYKLTTNENVRLIQFRVMTRVYYTRDKICKFDNTASDKCLKCNRYSDSLMHALWHCKGIKKIWKSIESWLCKYTNKTIVFSPRRCIFQDIEGMRYPTSWQLLFSSLILKKLIVQNWKNKEAPSIENWKALMKYYLCIERSMSEDKNKKKQFESQWSQIYNAL